VDRGTDAASVERQSEVRRHLPPAFRLVPLESEADFIAAAARLKARLDSDRAR
jgi:hypothetical protein